MRHRQETHWLGEGCRGERAEMEGWGGQASHDITQMALFVGPTWRGSRSALPPPALLPGSHSNDLAHSQMCDGRHHPHQEKHSSPFAQIQCTLTHPHFERVVRPDSSHDNPKHTFNSSLPYMTQFKTFPSGQTPLCEQLHGTCIQRQFTSKQRFTPPSYCCVPMQF